MHLIQEFQWDEANTAHIDRHRVAPAEAEEALTSPGCFIWRLAGDRFGAYGTTDAGRYLFLSVYDGRIAQGAGYHSP